MKKLNFADKIIFLLNSVIALMLLLSYILPKLEPRDYAILSVLSLVVPLLIILNILFVIYWIIKAKKQLLLSLLVLLIGFGHMSSLYKFSSSDQRTSSSAIRVMNFNVRLFNLYEWIEEEELELKIESFITRENPDVISFQEYHPHENISLVSYPYKYEELSGSRVQYGQAIFSKYPIINKGSIAFPNTSNNAVFADIVKGNDTIRIYNVHLQSLYIDENIENLDKEKSERLIKSASIAFKKQQEQAELFLAHKNTSPYRSILCGDFNNTAYSYVYNEIKGDYKDAFLEAGKGFGKTYKFKYFPIRIDFILVDPELEVIGFKNYKEKLSDHSPILAVIELHK